MAFKEWFQKLRPVQLYVVLVLTGVFFAVELIISHFTHSLTLLVDSYHMLCNMIALAGCIITIKKLHPNDQERSKKDLQIKHFTEVAGTNKENCDVSKSARRSESSLMNTFGWARVDILVMLIGCIFLGSLCFGVLVEAVQTLVHIDHHDEMHFPLVVLTVAAAGLLLNGFCYSLIGGYTFHQGSYLHVTETGEVILERTVTIDSLRKGQRRLSSQSRRTALAEPRPGHSPSQRQGLREMLRDVIGCVYVIFCGSVVYFTTGHHFTKYLDPIISVISAVSLLLLSFPYMKESGLILLQTIPDDINIDSLRCRLLQAFPDIVNVHDLHVWQLTADKIFSTAHIIFLDPADYLRVNKEMTTFFYEQGITQVTIQAEFMPAGEEKNRKPQALHDSHSKPCLMQCLTEDCRRRHCCIAKEDLEQKGQLETIKKLPLSGAIVDENGQLRGTGIAFDLIHEIQEKVGFYYNITLPEDNIVGNEKEGIIKMLKNKEVDMAVAFIPMTQLFRELVTFSSALAEFEWVLFMARPSASASGSGLLAPFQETVWMFILISLIIAGPVMYFITFTRIKLSTGNNSRSKAYSLSTCFWFVYGALMKQGSTLNPVYDSSRLFFATWWIFITILTSFYTANLTAFLTLSQFTLTIQTTRDIYLHHKHWMADKGGYAETLISSDNAFDYLKETIPKYGQFVSDPLEQRLQRVLKGEIYVTEKRQAEVIMMKDYLNKTRNRILENKRCTFVLTPKSVLAKPVGFAYRKDSDLKSLFDPMLTYLMSGGIITHLLNEGLPITSICPLNLANRERKLLNSDLATTYKTVAVGFGSAVAAFIGEIIFRFIKKRGKRKKEKNNTEAAQNAKPSLNNLFLINEFKSGSKLNDNFIISQYHNEIVPYKYGNNYILQEEKLGGLIVAQKQSKDILFQYTH